MKRTCYACKQTLPLEAFITRKDKPQGRGYLCTPCNRQQLREWRKNNPDKHAAQTKRWQQKNPEKRKAISRKGAAKHRAKFAAVQNAYKLTHEEYAQLAAKQENRCALCKADGTQSRGKKLHVDHCHESLRIRGLLCHACNSGLGHFERLQRLGLLPAVLSYLNQTSS